MSHRNSRLVAGAISGLGRHCLAPIGALLLAGCANPGNWVKAGSDAPTTEREYRDCRALADSAITPETQVDQDITATRGADWQRAEIMPVKTADMNDHLTRRADAIVDSCMRAKGFAKTG